MNRPHSSGPDDPEPIQPESWPDPPEPSAARWEKVRSGIHARLPVRAPRKPWAAVVTAAGIAAAVLVAVGVWAAVNPATQPTVPVAVATNPEPIDPLAEYDVLPIATASDVMVSAVRGNDIQFGSIHHPIPDVMPLMTGADVIVLKGPAAGELSCPDPDGMAVYVMPSDK